MDWKLEPGGFGRLDDKLENVGRIADMSRSYNPRELKRRVRIEGFMSGQQLRLVIGGLVIAMLIASVAFLAHGYGAAGVLAFIAALVLLGLGTRREQKVIPAAVSPSARAPKPASAPPDGHIRYTVVVEALAPARIAEVWTDLCRPDRENSESFRRLFRDFTVLEGNRFRFRSGDPKTTAALLSEVLTAASGVPVRTSIEPAAERTPIWS
jgi:hypothetical protein